MQKYSFPLTIQLEIFNSSLSEWEVHDSFVADTKSALTKKMQYLKSYYNLKGKDYRIILIINSKMNKC